MRLRFPLWLLCFASCCWWAIGPIVDGPLVMTAHIEKREMEANFHSSSDLMMTSFIWLLLLSSVRSDEDDSSLLFFGLGWCCFFSRSLFFFFFFFLFTEARTHPANKSTSSEGISPSHNSFDRSHARRSFSLSLSLSLSISLCLCRSFHHRIIIVAPSFSFFFLVTSARFFIFAQKMVSERKNTETLLEMDR